MPVADRPGAFLPLLARVSEALRPGRRRDLAAHPRLRRHGDGSLALTVEAPDLATLQAVETDLTAAGLAVSSGVATTSDTGAEVRTVIGGGP